MQALSREIDHPSGIKIKTPLLIPSFSSKGFSTDGKKSEIKWYIKISTEFITESILISAYDINYRHLPSIRDLNFASVAFIDSGGYETSGFYDFSEIKKQRRQALRWNDKLYLNALKKWPVDFPAVIINYDSPETRFKLEKQIINAKRDFAPFNNQLKDFLIKPETKKERTVNIASIIKNIPNLKDFNIIGITEKELGDSTLKRMVNISKLRRKLDENNIASPIHIFGCLDPLNCILYFMVGAEIFDGLTWLRYSFNKCIAIYTRNFNILNQDIGIHTEDEQVISASITNNIYFLQKLKYIMKEFAKSNDFSVLNDLGSTNMSELIKKIYESFKSNED